MLERLQAFRLAYQQQPRLRMFVEKLTARRERDAGAVIAPHAVNSQCDHGRLADLH